MIPGHADSYWMARLLLQRGIGCLYLVGFLAARLQFRALLGESGLLPVPRFVARTDWRSAPGIFQWRYSDRLADGLAVGGIVLSVLVVSGLADAGPIWLSILIWLALYGLYLSFVNAGQTFYGFGWESMLLEAGFFAAFLGPTSVQASFVPVFILRWMLFRTELGAGLIKLRHDPCWRDLTCLYYHYETQPMPNALSWYFHWLPKPVHRFSVAFSHVVQVICPFGLLCPQPIAAVCGAVMILQQLILIVSGNYAWLNWMTVVLAASAFSDRTLGLSQLSFGGPRPVWFDVLLWGLAGITVLLSIKPTLNFFARHQSMNASYNPFHLVGSYGAFGSMSRERYEVVLEGTDAETIDAHTAWREYPFRGKPGDPFRRPPQWAPYHLRLDWMMWFLPFGVEVYRGQVMPQGYPAWFMALVGKLLVGDPQTLALLAGNPFPDAPPKAIRARYYLYRFTTPDEHRESGLWWVRTLLGDFLPPVGLPSEQPERSARSRRADSPRP